MEKDKYGKYISLLEANKNLILTGAPGTGKTYLAKKIAKAMGAKYEFVQFHPSYDYTDFVEGLRPVPTDKEGQIGFERKDGIFKAFCKKALNVDNMDKSSSRSFEYFYYELVDDIRSRKVVTIKLRKQQPSQPLHVSDSKIIRWTNANGGESSNMVSLNRLSRLHEVYKTVADIDSITNINDAIRKVIGGANLHIIGVFCERFFLAKRLMSMIRRVICSKRYIKVL